MPIKTNPEKYRIAKEKGYTSTKDGNIIGIQGRELSLNNGTNGYKYFYITYKGKNISISVHRFIAYEKFGESALKEGILTRHVDGTRDNNHWDNIKIGTPSDNYNDIPNSKKKQMVLKKRKYDYNKIISYYKKHEDNITVADLVRRFDINDHTGARIILKSDDKYKDVERFRKYDHDMIINYYKDSKIKNAELINIMVKKFDIEKSALYYILNKYDKFKNINRRRKYDYDKVIEYYKSNNQSNEKTLKRFGMSRHTLVKILKTDPEIKTTFKKRRNYNHQEIIKYSKENKNASNKEIMQKFDIKNLASLYYILKYKHEESEK